MSRRRSSTRPQVTALGSSAPGVICMLRRATPKRSSAVATTRAGPMLGSCHGGALRLWQVVRQREERVDQRHPHAPVNLPKHTSEPLQSRRQSSPALMAAHGGWVRQYCVRTKQQQQQQQHHHHRRHRHHRHRHHHKKIDHQPAHRLWRGTRSVCWPPQRRCGPTC